MRTTFSIALSGCLYISAALAQDAPSRADPSDPKASVPATVYRSSFKDYRPLTQPGPDNWREVNDTVGRIGGWKVYLREAQQPDPPKPAASAKPAAPASPTPVGGAHTGPSTHKSH
jgi:hypothetical protein